MSADSTFRVHVGTKCSLQFEPRQWTRVQELALPDAHDKTTYFYRFVR